jgi:pimeloyl-ACP methyl ester carboxylesterase
MVTQPDDTRPTIVLVHGAWADATGFDRQIRALQGRGFRAVGFGNPLRGLPGDATYLADFLRTLTGPIVLVGHSYGGMVISAAATGNDQVKALVYFNGWMPDEGESQQQLFERFEGSLVGPAIRPVPFTGPDGAEGADLYLDPEAFHEAFAADVDRATADVMAAAQRPFTARPRSVGPRARPPGRRAFRAGTCWAPRTGRSRRCCSGSWPSARTRPSWRCRPPTSRSSRSPRPRPTSSCRPSRPRRPPSAAPEYRGKRIASPAWRRGVRPPRPEEAQVIMTGHA